jgi:hypothetical protein
MPSMCERRNTGQHAFVPSFRVGLGQATTSLPELMFEAYARPHPLFKDGRPSVWCVLPLARFRGGLHSYRRVKLVARAELRLPLLVRLIPILERNVRRYWACL